MARNGNPAPRSTKAAASCTDPYVSDALTANIDLGKPSAQWKPTVKEVLAAAKHQQQMEMDHALAKDFLDTYKHHRIAQLKSGGTTSPELERLAAEVRRKACSVKTKGGSMSADERLHLEEVRTFWNRVQEVTNDFELGKMPALEAQRQIYLLSGGRGQDDLTDRVGTVIASLGKMKQKK